MEFENKLLGNIQHLLDIRISEDFIGSDPANIYIIHGTKDEVVPLENSKHAAAAASGTLEIVEGADHSFKTEEEEHLLLEATRCFLRR